MDAGAKTATGFKVITEAGEEEAPTEAAGNGTITGVAVAEEAVPQRAFLLQR